jgi:hypothetical protein
MAKIEGNTVAEILKLNPIDPAGAANLGLPAFRAARFAS